MEKICRTCAKERKKLLPLYTEDLKFILMGHETVGDNTRDDFPKKICQECVKNLALAVKFVRECIEAQKKLKDLGSSMSFTEKKTPKEVQTRTRKSLRKKSVVPKRPDEVIKEDIKQDFTLPDVHFVDETRHSSDEESPDVKPKVDSKEVVQKISSPSDKSYQCSYCQRAFNNKFRLKNHFRIHTGERPYICKTCNKAFAQPNALKCHIRLHTGEKPYKCPVETCGKSFTQNTTLKTHMALHVGKNVKCDSCEKTFTRASYLKAHQRLEHLGQRPYACHICPNRYKQKSHLDHHLEVHQGVKYSCPICNRKYSKKWSLQVHSYTHLKEVDKDNKLPHACVECEESFARKDKLRAHVKTRHGNGLKKEVKSVTTARQEEVPAPSNVVEVESRPIILQEGPLVEGLKEFHVINITEGPNMIQEIVIPNSAIFYSDGFK